MTKRKGYKTSPSIRLPKAKKRGKAPGKGRLPRMGAKMQAAAAAAAKLVTWQNACRDAVDLIDLMHQRAGKRPLPLLDGAEIRRLDVIRDLVARI
jgi:alpha-L-fucosidase